MATRIPYTYSDLIDRLDDAAKEIANIKYAIAQLAEDTYRTVVKASVEPTTAMDNLLGDDEWVKTLKGEDL